MGQQTAQNGNQQEQIGGHDDLEFLDFPVSGVEKVGLKRDVDSASGALLILQSARRRVNRKI
jgi:hypothetical protein